jgi:hypothetical protein
MTDLTPLFNLRLQGITLTVKRDRIVWEADRRPTEIEAGWIVANKPALLRELTAVRLDIETESAINIKLGVQAYLRDPKTKVLLLAWSVGIGEGQVWRPGGPAPRALLEALKAGGSVVSHGAFDRMVWEAQMVPLGWPAVPAERWSDTVARCRAYRAPASLEKAAERLELGFQKDPAGEALIRRATEAARGG